ncbi:MAG: type II toxin-antitoxin system VapC family toxin [Patescibacteria group bacterium]
MRKFLVDSNIIIDQLRQFEPARIFFKSAQENSELYLSTVSLVEIYSGTETKEVGRLKIVEELVASFEISFLTPSIARQAGFLRRDYKKSFADMIIAATALEYGFILATRNTKDFQAIPLLKLLKPYG